MIKLMEIYLRRANTPGLVLLASLAMAVAALLDAAKCG